MEEASVLFLEESGGGGGGEVGGGKIAKAIQQSTLPSTYLFATNLIKA